MILFKVTYKVCAFPGNGTDDLGIARTVFYYPVTQQRVKEINTALANVTV